MPYTSRTKDDPLDMGRAVDQNDSVDNDAFFYAEIRYAGIEVFDPATAPATGDGKKYISIPAGLAGYNLVSSHAYHPTAGAGGNPTLVQIHNVTDAADMLTTRIMIDVGEKGSDTATTPYVIDTTHDDVAIYDVIRIDVDQLPTGTTKGLVVTLGFQHP